MSTGPTPSQKLVLVTGGSRGLGRNTAIHAAEAGFDVIITYNTNAKAAAEVVAAIVGAGRKGAALRLDTGDIASFERFAAELKTEVGRLGHQQIFGLVNNAGIGLDTPFGGTSEEVFDQLVNIHFKGVFFLTQTLSPLIADGGRIINFSSGLARVALPGFAVYGAVKGAVEVLTRYFAKELGPRGIAVNVIAPGGIETDFGGGALRDIPEVKSFIASQTALGRPGLPDDIGPVVAALLSPSHQWVNAQRLEVSGGWML
jgi:NAD(P)-dependent dehydrogenase (short-subunit alcohol dehydrogenase family)